MNLKDEASIREQFANWLEHPMTLEVQAYLRRRRQEFLEAWSRGDFTHESSEASAQLNAKALGKVNAIEEFLDIDADLIINSSKEN